MYRKIRITVVSLVVIATTVLSSVGTLSYFTDTDSKTNDFMIGNASSKLMIYNNVAGGDEHIFNASGYTLVDNMVIPFYLQAENDGNIPVYQRFRVVIPIALKDAITLELPCTLGGASTDAVRTCENDDYIMKYDSSVSVGSTPTYAEYYITRKNTLGVNQKTAQWPVTAINVGTIPSDITESSEAVSCENGDSNNCVLGVRAYSDVIQASGSLDAVSAFENFTETY